jgi:hypothetical protein
MRGVVHPYDPLTPGQVLDRVTRMRPFPVQYRRDGRGVGVQQRVVRAVVAVHEHRVGRVWPDGKHPREIECVEPAQGMTAPSPRVSLV